MEALRELGAAWDVRAAASVWVAGLWSASWAWRPALTGALLARAVPEHESQPYRSSTSCRVCGTDAPAVLASADAWYRRHTAGVPIDGDVPWHVPALEELADQPRPAPSEHDRWLLRAVLTVLRALPDGNRLLDTTAVHAYGSVLEELALVGVVATAEHPGLAERWSDCVERDQRPNDRIEVQAPLAWWRSSDGLRPARGLRGLRHHGRRLRRAPPDAGPRARFDAGGGRRKAGQGTEPPRHDSAIRRHGAGVRR
ncbi:hypothetical protein ACWEOE_07240 [Amycolatopsis sp. NPDC004368]